MIELTGRKYAERHTDEDRGIIIGIAKRWGHFSLTADKRDADIMLAAMKEKPDAVDPAV